MKKLLAFAVFCLSLSLVAAPVSAAGVNTGPFSADSILADPLEQGGLVLSGQLEIYTANQAIINDGDGNPEWDALKDAGIESFVLTVIPVRLAYGITDDISVRVTIPYVSQTLMFTESMSGPYDEWDAAGGGNFGDIRIEALYEVVKEGESMPSIGANLGVKLATGPYDRDYFGMKEPMLGTGSTDYSLTGVVKKQIGPVIGKALLSYVITGPTNYTPIGAGILVVADPAEKFVYSITAAYPVSPLLEVGGEIWGVIGDLQTYRVDGMPSGTWVSTRDDTAINEIILSPYVVYSVMDDFTVRGAIEIPLTQQPTFNLSDSRLHTFNGNTVTVGGSWRIM